MESPRVEQREKKRAASTAKTVESLILLMAEHDLSEIYLQARGDR